MIFKQKRNYPNIYKFVYIQKKCIYTYISYIRNSMLRRYIMPIKSYKLKMNFFVLLFIIIYFARLVEYM